MRQVPFRPLTSPDAKLPQPAMTLSQPPDTHSARLSFVSHPYRWRGLCIEGMVIATWLFFIAAGLLGLNPGAGHWAADATWILATTFLSTGVFITAHDSMHGLVVPFHPAINRFVGRHPPDYTPDWTMTSSKRPMDYITGLRPPKMTLTTTRATPLLLVRRLHAISHHWSVGVDGRLLWTDDHRTRRPRHPGGPVLGPPLVLHTQLFTVGTWTYRPGYRGTGHLKTLVGVHHPLVARCYHFGYHYEHHARQTFPGGACGGRDRAQAQPSEIPILSSTTSIS